MSDPRTPTSQSGYSGQWSPLNSTSRFNTLVFIMRQVIGQNSHVQPVKVIAVHVDDGVSPVGMVDVQVMVNLLDGAGNSSEHGTIYGLPYFRLQGGGNAIICDPAVDDIGICCFADRDISSVVRTKAVANPGSARRFSFSDGLYIGGILNGTPTQYVRFTDGGMQIVDKNGNTITTDSAGVTINGVLIDRNGNVGAPGEVTRGVGGADSVALGTHKHPTAATGAPSPPTPGT